MSAGEGQEFWDYIDRLVAGSKLVIDRPRGARHPRYPELVYPLDYGYLDGTVAADGGGIDIWSGSLAPPLATSVVMTVDLNKRDAELKILLGCTETEMETILAFHNDQMMRAFLVRREAPEMDWITNRRSVRRFRPDPIPAQRLERLLEAALWAPSAHNRQPWRFAVLASLEAKARLGEAMGADFRRDLLKDGLSEPEAETQVARSCQRIREAPAAVLLCLDMTGMDTYPEPARQEAEFIMAVQSVAMAGENLLLAAHTAGLGGVWVCAPLFAQETVRRALDLPAGWQPQGLILLGYPAKRAEARPRRPLDEVARFL
jgi:F420 biosynthesis protein FbiB-like protein